MSHGHTRRDFLGLAGGGVAAAWAGVALPGRSHAAASDPRRADLVVFNANVYTVDPQMPRAQAFAVRGGRFIAVGANDEIRAFIGKATQTLDAKQMTIVPGFIDCHNHAPGNELL